MAEYFHAVFHDNSLHANSISFFQKSLEDSGEKLLPLAQMTICILPIWVAGRVKRGTVNNHT